MKPDLWQEFRQKAACAPTQRLVLADGEDPRVIQAAAQAMRERLAQPVLIGSRSKISELSKSLGADAPTALDPAAFSDGEIREFVDALRALPKFKSLSASDAQMKILDPLVLGCLCVKTHRADGFVGGAARTTSDTLRAVLSIIGLAEWASTLFGFFLVEPRTALQSPLLLFADCAVIPEPSAKQLAKISLGAATAFRFFLKQEPRIALLSFSTAGSAGQDSLDKIRQARDIARAQAPDLALEGEWQADAALDPVTAGIKGVGHSAVAGRANVLIFPDLNAGNIAYKLAQRLGGCRAVGPVLWGAAAPANDLSRGCSAEDILDMMALTSLQAQACRQKISSAT